VRKLREIYTGIFSYHLFHDVLPPQVSSFTFAQ